MIKASNKYILEIADFIHYRFKIPYSAIFSDHRDLFGFIHLVAAFYTDKEALIYKNNNLYVSDDIDYSTYLENFNQKDNKLLQQLVNSGDIALGRKEFVFFGTKDIRRLGEIKKKFSDNYDSIFLFNSGGDDVEQFLYLIWDKRIMVSIKNSAGYPLVLT